MTVLNYFFFFFLHYFQQDTNATGVIDITRDSFVRPERKKESKFTYAVGTSRRVFFMYTDNQEVSVITWLLREKQKKCVSKNTDARSVVFLNVLINNNNMTTVYLKFF